MKVKIKNFMAIAEADIDFSRTTVLVGDNGSGKSSIAKLVFLYMKSRSIYSQNFAEIFTYNFNRNNSDIVSKVLDLPYIEIMKRVSEIGVLLTEKRFDESLDKLVLLEDEFERKLPSYSAKMNKNQFYIREGTFFRIHKESIECFSKGEIHVELYNSFLYALYLDVFRGVEFVSTESAKNNKGFDSKVVFSNQESLSTNLSFGFNSHGLGIGMGQVKLDNIAEVTYYSSPFIIDVSSLILSSTTYYDKHINFHAINGEERNNVTNYLYKDVCKKLSHQMSESKAFNLETLGNIQFGFDPNTNTFHEVYDGMRISSAMSASGKKSLAQILSLFDYHKKKERSLILMDEPESHLHPELQVELAILISKEVKNNTNLNLIITSHSNFFIDALNAAFLRENIGESINFYKAKIEKDGRYKFNEKSLGIESSLDSFINAYKKISDLYIG